MKEKKIFCIYGWFSVSRYIEEGRKSLCRRNWIYKHTCMYEQPTLTKQWNYSIFVNLLYSYFKYTNRLFLGCVLFVGCCSIIWASRETKKERLSYRKRYSERGLYALLSMSFFLLSLSTHSPFPSDVLAEWPLLLRGVFCVMISWLNRQKYENFMQFNTSWLSSLRTRYYFSIRISFSCSSYDLILIKKSNTLNC